jgi:hypothetical protein
MPSADNAKVVRRRAKRYEVVHNCAIAATCNRFLKGRGMTAQSENFNRSNPKSNQEPTMIQINELGPESVGKWVEYRDGVGETERSRIKGAFLPYRYLV